MSVQAITWAFEQSGLSTGQKFLLVAVSNHADKYGVCYPGRRSLAEDCSCTIQTVSENMAKLEKLGFIARQQRRRRNGSRTSDWIVLAPDAVDREPLKDAPVEEYPAAVAHMASRRDSRPESGRVSRGGQVGISGRPEPSEEPSVDDPSDHHGDAGHLRLVDEPQTAPRQKVATVDRKTVTRAEFDQAHAILAFYNEKAETRQWAKEHYERIVRRMREFPEINVDGHKAVIAKVLAEDWWDRADVRIIYGSEEQFERCAFGESKPRSQRAQNDAILSIARRMQSGDFGT